MKAALLTNFRKSYCFGAFTVCIFSAVVLKAQECTCGNAFSTREGVIPDLTYEFPNGQTLAFCGGIEGVNWDYMKNPKSTQEPDTVFWTSEFSVFSCSFNNQSKSWLASYGAIHTCSIELDSDSAVIDRLYFLYDNESSEWKGYSLGRRIIKPIGDSLHLSDELAILEIPPVHIEDVPAFFAQDYSQMDYETLSVFLGELEILALNKNQLAIDLLFSQELKDATIAATTEHLYRIREVYSWVILNQRNDRYWDIYEPGEGR